MKYKDGLHRYRKYIADIITKESGKPDLYYEPMCGRCHVGIRLEAGTKIFTDIHEPIISLFQELDFEEWSPPYFAGRKIVSYIWSRPNDFMPYVQGFFGHAYSRTGEFFGELIAYDRFKSAGVLAYQALLRDLATLKETSEKYMFGCVDFRNAQYYDKSVIFLHPPQDDMELQMEMFKWIAEMRDRDIQIYVALNSNLDFIGRYKKHFKLNSKLIYPVIYKVREKIK